MKKLKTKNIMLYFAIILWISTPFTSFASDMWKETPNLNHETKIESVINEIAIFTSNLPLIDMWAETPDLSKEKKDDGLVFDIPSRSVDHFDHEMYAETPDLRVS